MDIESLLKSHGKSITKERIELYEGIQNLHLFQASDLTEKFPHIGRASIFRVLNLFVDIGILRKLILDDRGDFYELEEQSHHEHFECKSCHTVFHFDARSICKMLEYLAKKQGFLLKNHQILLSGVCPNCNQH
ncbi:MAG: Fur family transcriptional regulator [Candidatus Altimarinota bacterium]